MAAFKYSFNKLWRVATFTAQAKMFPSLPATDF